MMEMNASYYNKIHYFDGNGNLIRIEKAVKTVVPIHACACIGKERPDDPYCRCKMRRLKAENASR